MQVTKERQSLYTQQEALRISQQVYAEAGFLVVACRFPHDIGEILEPEDDYLQSFHWRVVAESSVDEMRQQLAPYGRKPPNCRQYFYRIEAMD